MLTVLQILFLFHRYIRDYPARIDMKIRLLFLDYLILFIVNFVSKIYQTF